MLIKKPLLSPDKAGGGTGAKLAFIELVWQRPYEQTNIESVLAQLANMRPRGPIVFEARMVDGRLRYLLGVTPAYLYRVKRLFTTFGNVHFYDTIPPRKPVICAQSLKLSNSSLSLNTNFVPDVMRAAISSLASISRAETGVVQIVLGPSYDPDTVSKKTSDPNASWLDIVLGNANQATPETLKSMRTKADQFTFAAAVRIGASGYYSYPNVIAVSSSLTTLVSAGVKMRAVKCHPDEINNVQVPAFLPWQMPLRLSVKEIVPLLLLPFGEEEIIGAPALHPKELLPPNWYRGPIYNLDKTRIFAESLDGKKLNISDQDSRYHTAILGPTGSGKSTVMLNMIMQDINANRSVLVIDPKADLVNDVLARVPEERLDDVVVIDPSSANPTGFNPLKVHRGQSPSLVTDAIMSVLQNIFADVWGIRSQDTINASLLTLTQIKDANLMWLPTLLTDQNFRKQIVSKLPKDIATQSFWHQYEEMKDGERRTYIESTLNKMRQILYRPGLRAILGQSNPSFDLLDLFTQRKIVLVPLNKGLVGADTAKLLGSMIVGLTWTLALSRAKIPPEKRHTICMYIDELQDYLHLPTSFSDALAQARGLGLGITVAHQYRAQLTPDIRQGIDANCRNKIVYGLSNPDAREMSMQAPELAEEDFMTLPRYHIYTNFLVNGRATNWIYGKTAPPSEPLRLPAEGKAHAEAKYGKPAATVDEELASILITDSAEKQVEEETAKTKPLIISKRRTPS